MARSASRPGTTRRSPRSGRVDARLLIVGLAPGLRGANRTGRPFTGDYAGDLLYATLIEYGFAKGRFEARPDDGLTLVDARITNAVRCVPPENKPTAGRDPHLPDVSRPRRSPRCRSLPRSWRSAASRMTRRSRRSEAKRSLRRSGMASGARARTRAAVRQLSLLALQHEHRRADARYVPQRVRDGARLLGRRVAASGYLDAG